MKPGETTWPVASIVSRAVAAARSPTASMRPSRIPTSARRAGAPVPSRTSPPRIRRSSATRGAYLARKQLPRAAQRAVQIDGLETAGPVLDRPSVRLGRLAVRRDLVPILGAEHEPADPVMAARPGVRARAVH